MALVAAVVCPHPPLLVPEVGLGVEVPVRAAALQAVAEMVSSDPDLVVVVGDGPVRAGYGAQDSGSFAGFGVDLVVPLDADADADADDDESPAALPLALTVGGWLLQQTGWPGPRRALAVPSSETTESAAALGAELAGRAERVALLCMGDGSARRSEKAPGWWDERAEPFDAAVSAALGSADASALLALDAGLADELMAVGRASWQVLAGACAGGSWTGRLRYDDAPFGVGYVVAQWTRQSPPTA
jgi:hypothetical protein